jgi:hypothetical protein
VFDLRAFGKGRKFFKTCTEANAERLGKSRYWNATSAKRLVCRSAKCPTSSRRRGRLAEYGETISDAGHSESITLIRVCRHGITVARLADEVAEAKRRDCGPDVSVRDLRCRLNEFVQDFGHLPTAGITLDELDQECETCPTALRCASSESRTGAQRFRVGHPMKTTKSRCDREELPEL